MRCDVMNGTEYLVWLETRVVLIEESDVVVHSEELIGAAEYLTLKAGCGIKRRRYNRVRLCM